MTNSDTNNNTDNNMNHTNISNDQSYNNNTLNNSRNNIIHRPPPVTRHGFRRNDLIRIIAQGLNALGLPQSASTVVQESGVPIHRQQVDRFRSAVLDGDWSTATELVPHLGLRHTDTRRRVLFLLHRQQFLEEVEAGNTASALSTLRSHLAPESPGSEHLHRLSALVMLRDPVQLRAKAHWDGASGKSRRNLLETLQRCIPPSVLLPEDRLECLLRRSISSRSDIYHHQFQHNLSDGDDDDDNGNDNGDDDDNDDNDDHDSKGPGISLLREEPDPASLVPRRCVHVLAGHHDEVWFVAFSPDGRVLASASKDATVIIYQVDRLGDNAYRPVVGRGHAAPVTYLAFSPDSSHLLSVSADRTLRLWVVPEGRCIRTFASHDAPVSSVVWLDNHTFVSSGEREDRTIRRWDADTGDELSCVTLDHRIQDMALCRCRLRYRSRSHHYRHRFLDHQYSSGDVRTPQLISYDDRIEPVDADIVYNDDEEHNMSDIDHEDGEHSDDIINNNNNNNNSNHPENNRSDTNDRQRQRQRQRQRRRRRRRRLEHRLVVAGPSENALYVYDPSNVTPSQRRTLSESKGVTSVAASPDGRFLLVNLSCSPHGAGASCIRMWDMEEQRVVREYVGQRQDRFIVRSTFGAGAQLVVSGSEDCSVHVWDCRTGNLMVRLPGHTDAITAVAHNPASAAMYASASDDGTVRVWDTDTDSMDSYLISSPSASSSSSPLL